VDQDGTPSDSAPERDRDLVALEDAERELAALEEQLRAEDLLTDETPAEA
jgi:hypothetical protein